MLSNYENTNVQARHGLVPRAWHSLSEACGRALRQARGRATAADVAARLAAYGIHSTGRHEADTHMPAELYITHDVHVRVEPGTMCVLAYDGDLPKYYPDRSHGDIVALVQDILAARALVVAWKEEYLRARAAPDWTSTAASDLAGELVRCGVPHVRLVRNLDASQEGLIEVGTAPWIGVEVIAGDCFKVIVASDTDMLLHYPPRQDAGSLVADIADARTYVFPPCRPS
jgi:hypothetical protein